MLQKHVFLVNPNASLYHAQQNISHNYSLHTNQLQSNHYESFNQTNFNNYDPNQLQQNQFALLNVQLQSNIEGQQQQLQHQTYQQQNQFINQTVNTAGINGPSSSTSFPQNSINDLLIVPTGTLQQNLFNNQDQTQQVSNNLMIKYSNINKMSNFLYFRHSIILNYWTSIIFRKTLYFTKIISSNCSSNKL